jgi:bifunctional DNA-binding transcriptional regulator/antitoxin component of YhaV-PrlF toxin-antitoxin module
MATTEFELPIGLKRQVTMPQQLMDLLSLEEGQTVLVQVEGGRAILRPMVSVVRDELPEALRKKFESRRGKKPTDIPLSAFTKKLEQQKKKAKKAAAVTVAAGRAASAK